MKNNKSLSAIFCLVLIALFAAANILSGTIGPSAEIDLSERNVYEISPVSEDMVSRLDIEAQIIILSDDPDPRIVKFVDKYCALSEKLSCRSVSPVQHPEMLVEFGASADSLIVSCPEKGSFRAIDFEEIIEYDLMRYAYYGEYKETNFDAESEISNALADVINEKSYIACISYGHGEEELTSAAVEELKKARFEPVYRDLMVEGLPQDCDTVIINSPERDISSDEAVMLRDFIEAGGNVVWLLGSSQEVDFSALSAIAGELGIVAGDGIVRDPGSCYQNEYLIFPAFGSSSDITRYLPQDAKCLLNRAMEIEIIDESESLRVYELLHSSPEAVSTNVFGESEGPACFSLGAYAQLENVGSFAILPASIIEDTILNNYGNLNNAEVFVNTLVCGVGEERAYVIAPVALGSSLNAVESASIYSIATVGIIPVLLLILGAAHCIRRRRS